MTLAIRGIYYITTIQPLYSLIKESRLGEFNMNMPLAMFVSWVHTLGGTFIILGLLTRISAWAQIPIVLGAIIFINLNNSLSHSFPELLLSVVVLILLFVFACQVAERFRWMITQKNICFNNPAIITLPENSLFSPGRINIDDVPDCILQATHLFLSSPVFPPSFRSGTCWR